MYLQGELQKVFDALFQLGIIDPLLKKDWKQTLERKKKFGIEVDRAVDVANSFQEDVSVLISRLGSFERSTLEYLAMEVAQEYVEFNERKQVH